jgi:threonine/homoserine efflux transporter RhtA
VAVALSRRALDLVWVVLAAAGIVLLADPFGAGGVDTTGLAFILAAAACWSAYIRSPSARRASSTAAPALPWRPGSRGSCRSRPA